MHNLHRPISLLGDEGYAFPDIVSVPIIDDVTNIVDIEFRITPGQKNMVRRINITGNDNTNDEVYRRELRQFESAIHSNKKIERSIPSSRFKLQFILFLITV